MSIMSMTVLMTLISGSRLPSLSLGRVHGEVLVRRSWSLLPELEQRLPHLVLRIFVDRDAVGRGSARDGGAIAAERGDERGVDGHLGAVPQRVAIRDDLESPFVAPSHAGQVRTRTLVVTPDASGVHIGRGRTKQGLQARWNGLIVLPGELGSA